MKINKKYIDHNRIEQFWRERWSKEKIYEPDINKPKNAFYNLWMFPYPSAEGVHVGTIFASTGSDVYGRFKRMNGYNVFQPIGFDSFGIHSENYAIRINENPKLFVGRAVINYAKQFKMVSHGYDWKKTVTTSETNYYKWTQWLFVQVFKSGLAYKKKASVNWCPSCKTVLADEQVMSPVQAGKEAKDEKGNKVKEREGVLICERCGTVVNKKDLEQWFFRITDYADKLLENLNKINWPEKIKIAQTNWIGKKQGINIRYPIKDTKKEIEVWTSRPDTNFGATFIVASPEYAQKYLLSLVSKDRQKKINKYINMSLSRTYDSRIAEGRKKTGTFTGLYAINQLNGYEMPIWIADFVLADVGTGCVVSVPGHDKRDFEFAKEIGLEVKRVVVGSDKDNSEIKDISQVQEEEGEIVNSEFLDGLGVHEAIEKIMDYLESKGWGERITNYHLRDWLVSRQRYWGAPIPMIYCEKCAKLGRGWFTKVQKNRKTEKLKNDGKCQLKVDNPLDEKYIIGNSLIHKNQSDWDPSGWYPDEKLPVELPEISDFKPEGGGRGPLANHPEFYNTKCPVCGSDAKRETDVMDTFVDSSWYFLRYPSVNTNSKHEYRKSKQILNTNDSNSKRLEIRDSDLEIPWDRKITRNWLPVDLYFGGAEHSVLHLMYSRFITMVFNDLGYIDFDEPFPWFYAHGLMIKDGAKMSKSRGNVVNPDEYIDKFGADTLRLYLMFMGPMDGYPDFRDTGIEGMRRFIDRVWQLFSGYKNIGDIDEGKVQNINIKMHQTIKKVTEDIQNFRYNTAIASIMEYVNELRSQIQNSNVKNQKEGDFKNNNRYDILHEALKTLALLLAPFAPHITEEAWINVLGNEFSIHKTQWPKYNPDLIKEEEIIIAVQVNGKLRATIVVGSDESRKKDFVLKKAMSNEKIKIFINAKKIKRKVFVPGKILNIVTEELNI